MGALIYTSQSCSETRFPCWFEHAFPIAESQMSIKQFIPITITEKTAQADASKENSQQRNPLTIYMWESLALLESLAPAVSLTVHSPTWPVVFAPFVVQRIGSSRPLVSLGSHPELNMHLELQYTNQATCTRCIAQHKVGLWMLKVP